tara:strand:- start:644 stop:1057 length:414 start_codon:yes stop_codon:yes gene_type:complete
MAQTVSATWLVDAYEEAIATDRKLPAAYRKGYTGMQFDIKHDVTEHNAWDKKPSRVPATSKQIARYDFLLFHINPLLDATERKLVWARAMGMPYVALGKKLGMHRHTVKEKYLEVLIYIKYLVAYDKFLLDKFDKIK